MPPRPRVRLGCESLEARENPAPLLAENFDALKPPQTAYDFSYWGTGSYVTSKIVADSGAVALASTGSDAAESRYFSTHLQPADVAVSASIYSNTPTPAVLFARGEDLTNTSGSYLGARVHTAALAVDLVRFSAGTTTVLATLSVPRAAQGVWLDVTLTAVGRSLSASVQRADTMEFLAPDGSWQPKPLSAVAALVSPYTGLGSVGLGRSAGGAGMAFFDNFQVNAAAPTRENFNTTPLGARPDGWKSFVNDGTVGFAVSAPRAADSQGYTATGGTNTTARSWLDTPQPADVQASASLYADSLIPGTLIVRGSALDTAKPTYYGLTVSRGLEASLVRVVDGVTTTLGTIKSKAYVSGVWLRLALTASGDTLRAVIFRADTGQWLTPDGTWSDAPQPALEVTNKSVPAGGFVGVQRNPLAAGPVTFDDFEVRTGVATGPPLTVSASQAGNAFSGEVTFAASDDGTARRVEFRLNGKLVASSSKAPASYTLDTTALANGPQVLTVRATDNSGNPSTATLKFDTANANPTPLPPRPAIPRKLSYIRVAQLAYSGNPLGEFEQARLKDSVDLVVPNPKFLDKIDAASPATPQVIYSNISNLYQGLLLDWLGYADANKVDREAAFYHVSQPTPFSGSSPSSQPVTWFWSVRQGTVDLTSAAHGGQPNPVGFGGVSTTTSIGYPEKFAEVNFDIVKPAGGGWGGTLEYVAATDATGNPTSWKSLTLTANGTANFTKAGAITFALPADWVASRVGGGDLLFTIRVRATAGGAADAPTARTILGRDYVNAAGTTKGTIPVFDTAADKDGDGHLSDAEYAARAPGKDARFAYESRLFYPYYGQMRFTTNPSSAAVRNWAVAYHQQQLALNPLADGVFLDNSNGRLPTDGAKVVEGTETYGNDYAAIVSTMLRKLGNKIVVTNTSGGNADATPVAAVSTASLEEFLLRPTDVNWSGFNDVADLVKARLAADTPSPYVILDSLPGSFPLSSDRVKSSTLAYYYLLADSDRTFLMLFGGVNPSAPWSQTWINAIGTDVGQAKGAFTTFATGKDPQNAKLDYKVMAREYENALVLFKPRSYALGQGTGTADDATATTHALGGNYRVLHADGTLGPVVTTVTLRNGEGTVLLKA